MRSSASGHARLAFAGSMLVFGTIGLLRRFIDLPSAVIACFRGLLGCVLLLLLQRLRGRKPDLAALRRYLPALLISSLYWPNSIIAAIGAVYLAGRFLYRQLYLADPAKRSPGFLLTVVPTFVLSAAAIWGAVARAAT